MIPLEEITLEQAREELRRSREEFANLRSINANGVAKISPFTGYDIWGQSFPLCKDIGGGDLIHSFNFEDRFDFDRLIRGINDPELRRKLEETREKKLFWISDVAGHKMSDFSVAMGVKGILETAIRYELERNGEMTLEAVENLSDGVKDLYGRNGRYKFVTFMVGELAPNGFFRYVNAGNPPPLVYNAEQKVMRTLEDFHLNGGLPAGIAYRESHIHSKDQPMDREPYETLEFRLYKNDIMVLATDGLKDHGVVEGESQKEKYLETGLLKTLRESQHLSAKDIVTAIHKDMANAGPFTDDVTLAVIKRNS